VAGGRGEGVGVGAGGDAGPGEHRGASGDLARVGAHDLLFQRAVGDLGERDWLAAAPADAPSAVKDAIWAGNQLIGLPYVYGGGHGSFLSGGYDCSGTVSFALRGAGLLSAPEDSNELFDWGRAGRGRWLTVYTSAGHAFLELAGIRLDTSSAGDPSGVQGPRWRPLLAATSGYVARHAPGY